MVGFPNNHGVFLLKMIILGCFGGTTILGNTDISSKKSGGRVENTIYFIEVFPKSRNDLSDQWTIAISPSKT